MAVEKVKKIVEKNDVDTAIMADLPTVAKFRFKRSDS